MEIEDDDGIKSKIVAQKKYRSVVANNKEQFNDYIRSIEDGQKDLATRLQLNGCLIYADDTYIGIVAFDGDEFKIYGIENAIDSILKVKGKFAAFFAAFNPFAREKKIKYESDIASNWMLIFGDNFNLIQVNDTISNVYNLRLFEYYTDDKEFTNLPMSLIYQDIRIMPLENINEISTDNQQLVDKRILKYVFTRFKLNDALNNYIYSKLNFNSIKNNLDRETKKIKEEKEKKKFIKMYEYIKEPSLPFSSICSYFETTEESVISLYYDVYKLSGDLVKNQFYSYMEIDASEIGNYIRENLAFSTEFLFMDYKTTYHLNKNFLALLCALWNINKTGIYLLMNFIDFNKNRMNTDILVDETDYLRANYYRADAFNTFFTESNVEDDPIFNNEDKIKYNINKDQIIQKPLTLPKIKISKDVLIPLIGKFDIIPEIKPITYTEKISLMNVDNSYITEIERQKEVLLREYMTNFVLSSKIDQLNKNIAFANLN